MHVLTRDLLTKFINSPIHRFSDSSIHAFINFPTHSVNSPIAAFELQIQNLDGTEEEIPSRQPVQLCIVRSIPVDNLSHHLLVRCFMHLGLFLEKINA
jgi:hypothetical protein